MGVFKVVKVVKHVTSVKVEREKCGGRLPSQVRIIITLLPRYYIKCSISFYPGSTPQGGPTDIRYASSLPLENC